MRKSVSKLSSHPSGGLGQQQAVAAATDFIAGKSGGGSHHHAYSSSASAKPTYPPPSGGVAGGASAFGGGGGGSAGDLTVYKVRRRRNGGGAVASSSSSTASTISDTTRFSPASVMLSLIGTMHAGGNSAGGVGSQHPSLASSYSALAARSANAALFDAYRVARHSAREDDRVAALLAEHEAAVAAIRCGDEASCPDENNAAASSSQQVIPPPPHLLMRAPPPADLLLPAVHSCAFTQLGLKQVCPTCLFAQTGHDAAPDAALLDFAVAMKLLSGMGVASVANLVDSFYIFSACDRPALHCSGQSFFSLDRSEGLESCGRILEALRGGNGNGVGVATSPHHDAFVNPLPFPNQNASFTGSVPSSNGGANGGSHGNGGGSSLGNGVTPNQMGGVSSSSAASQAAAAAASSPAQLLATLSADDLTRHLGGAAVSGPTDLVACVSLVPHLGAEIVMRYLESCAPSAAVGKTANGKHQRAKTTRAGEDATAPRRQQPSPQDILFSLITVYVVLLQLPSVAGRIGDGEALNCLLRTVAAFPTPARLRAELDAARHARVAALDKSLGGASTSSTALNSNANSNARRRAMELLEARDAQEGRLLQVAESLHEAVSSRVVTLLHSVGPDDQLRLFCRHKLDAERPIAAGPEYDLWRSVAFYLYRKRRHELVKVISHCSLEYCTETIVPLVLNVQLPPDRQQQKQQSSSRSSSSASSPSATTAAASFSASSVFSRAVPSSEVHAALTDIAHGLLERTDAVARRCAVSSSLTSADDVFTLVRCGTVIAFLCGYPVHTYSSAWAGGKKSAGRSNSSVASSSDVAAATDPNAYDSVVARNQQKEFLERLREVACVAGGPDGGYAIPKNRYDCARVAEKVVELCFETPAIVMRWLLRHFNAAYALANAKMIEAYEKKKLGSGGGTAEEAGTSSGSTTKAGEPKSAVGSFTEKLDTGVVPDPMASTTTATNQTDPTASTAAAPTPVPPEVTLAATLWWADAFAIANNNNAAVAASQGTSDASSPRRLMDNPLQKKLLTEFAETLEVVADSAGSDCAGLVGAAPALRTVIRPISVLSSHEEVRETAHLFAVLGATDQLRALIQTELNQNVMLPSASIAILHDLVRRCPPNTPSYHILMSALTDLLVPPSASRSRWDDYVVMRQLVRSEHSRGRLDAPAHRALLRWTSTNATKSAFFSLVSARMVILGLLFAGYYSGNSLEGGLVRKRLKKKFKAEYAASAAEEQRRHVQLAAAVAASAVGTSAATSVAGPSRGDDASVAVGNGSEADKPPAPSPAVAEAAAALFEPLPPSVLPLAKGETVFATPAEAEKLLAFAANDVASLAANSPTGTLQVRRTPFLRRERPAAVLGASSTCPFRTQVRMTLYSPSPIDMIRDTAMAFRESLPTFWTGLFFLYPIYSPSVQRYLVRNVCDGDETVVVLRLAPGAAPLTAHAVEVTRKYCGPKCAIVFVGEPPIFAEVAPQPADHMRPHCAPASAAPAAAQEKCSAVSAALSSSPDAARATAVGRVESRLISVGDGGFRARCVFAAPGASSSRADSQMQQQQSSAASEPAATTEANVRASDSSTATIVPSQSFAPDPISAALSANAALAAHYSHRIGASVASAVATAQASLLVAALALRINAERIAARVCEAALLFCEYMRASYAGAAALLKGRERQSADTSELDLVAAEVVCTEEEAAAANATA